MDAQDFTTKFRGSDLHFLSPSSFELILTASLPQATLQVQSVSSALQSQPFTIAPGATGSSHLGFFSSSTHTGGKPNDGIDFPAAFV
jgi:hypothetical protein